ncbi:MAG: hypothetical protein ACLT9S_01515 [Faecalibacterium sp.]
MPGRQGSCPCAALADCPGDREQELADAEEKKTPSAREKAKSAVLEKYTDAQERLDKAAALLGRVEQLAVAGSDLPAARRTDNERLLTFYNT